MGRAGRGLARLLRRLAGTEEVLARLDRMRDAAAEARRDTAALAGQLVRHVDARTGVLHAEALAHIDARTGALHAEALAHIDARTGALHAEALAHVDARTGALHAEALAHVDARTGALHAEALGLAEARHAHLIGTVAALRTWLSEALTAGQSRLPGHLATERALLLDGIHRQLSHVDGHLSAHLSKQVALLRGGEGAGEAPVGDLALAQHRLLALGRLLEPAAVPGLGKRRVGREADGGYVMLDDLDRAAFALSLGVGDDVSWDLAVAEGGTVVHAFDHTIDAPPATHPNIRFHRLRIAPDAGEDRHSLDSALALGGGDEGEGLVKMDIEGDEWAVLDAVPPGGLNRVAQLAIELHGFEEVEDTAWFERAERVLRRLDAEFRVVHVHANNHGLLRARAGVAFPELLEVTFASRRLYAFEPSREVFPTPLDAPNRPDLPDISLGAFRF